MFINIRRQMHSKFVVKKLRTIHYLSPEESKEWLVPLEKAPRWTAVSTACLKANGNTNNKEGGLSDTLHYLGKDKCCFFLSYFFHQNSLAWIWSPREKHNMEERCSSGKQRQKAHSLSKLVCSCTWFASSWVSTEQEKIRVRCVLSSRLTKDGNWSFQTVYL